MSQAPGISHTEHGAAILGTLRRELGETKYDRWLGNASAIVQTTEGDDNHQTVVIEVENAFAARWVETKFIPELRTACKGLRSERTPPWRICVRQNVEEHNNEGEGATAQKSSDFQERDHGAAGHDSAETIGTDPSSNSNRMGTGPSSEWTPQRLATPQRQPNRANAGRMAAYRQLEHFVEGPSNQLAYRSVCRLLEDPQHASPMSPLFLHGDCGVGKTHLLQGAVRAASTQFSRVRYYSAEQFTNEYIRAVREHDLERFRQQLRTLDLLAIDDVHFFSHKEGTQNEFLHMLDACLLHGTKLLLAGDGHPNRFKAFSRALSSRCVSGMVVHIESPDVNTRLAIVNHLASRRGLRLEPAAATLVVERTLGTVRELEGALTRLDAMSRLENSGDVIGLQLVTRTLGAAATPRPVRPADVVNAVCEALNIPRHELLGNSRHRRITLARGVSAYLLRDLTTLSWPEIAHQLGRERHSTVHGAAKRITKALELDESTQALPEQGEVPMRLLIDRVRRNALQAERR
ncbi:MAG: hypothetical protein CMJ28_00445 [Phycisphaerae bacterium]|nr:hypothetical protein [Phycisphaerae bacterium]